MNIESDAVFDIKSLVTANGANAFNFSLLTASGSPMDIQTSVYTTLASLTASSGSVTTSSFAPVLLAIFLAL